MRRLITTAIIFLTISTLCVNAQTYQTEKKDTINYDELMESLRKAQDDVSRMMFGAPIDDSIREKANLGDPDAQYEMGIKSMDRPVFFIAHYYGEFEQEALDWFEKAAAKGHKKAAFMAAIIHYGMFMSFTRNDRQWQKRQTISYLKQAGLNDNPELMLYMADIYRFDQPKDCSKALEWCNRAISMGLPKTYTRKEPFYALDTSLGSAYYIKSQIYKYGDENPRIEDNHFSANPTKYFENLKISADLGFEDALYELGECYYLGRFVSKNLSKANSYWDLLPKDSWRYKEAQDLKQTNGDKKGGDSGVSTGNYDSSYESQVRQLLQD